jgi:hypothetical protein
LGKAQESSEVPEGHKIYQADTERGCNELRNTWYIDGSHQVHEDCQEGQTGSIVTFGAGAISSSSNKQKCNTKSLTKTEIIALHDKLSDMIWMRYFVECQGYDINECIIFQDNMSALSLEKNGRISSSKPTKHIKAMYFLIKDYYDAGEVDLPYCLTGRMWTDVLTKPLQGQMLRDMQAFLQNCSRGYDDDLERQQDEQAHQSTKEQVATVTSSRECVGAKQLRWADGVKVPKRDVSPTCVSRLSLYGSATLGPPVRVNGKEACKDTPELVLDRNTDRQRASVASH